ncbi:MAG: type I glyceraldehyde-3-phosphate dehydrogenase [Firmicutes bacterium]|nr:type I glyceraldehyde-3-phosphate dehydrogenase [Bacillota bacterium]
MNVGINGFGRIGRLVLRAILEKKPDFEVVAINDLGDPATMVHLFKYDSTYGKFNGEVKLEGDEMVVNGKKIKMLSVKDPATLPWKEMNVEYVIESTGVFRSSDKCQKHIDAGAKKVIISAPAKGSDIKTLVLGVNEGDYNAETDHIVSNASCTTNCLAPVAKVLHENFTIKEALMTTIHSYTNDQRILDLPHSDLRRTRAAGLNMIPTTTGAASATGKVIPSLKGKIDGISIRVPTPTVSLVDLSASVEKHTSVEEVNAKLREAAAGALKGILEVTDEELVSMDFKGNPASSIVDAKSTFVVGNMIKVFSWYDNEVGYSNRVVDLISYMMKK